MAIEIQGSYPVYAKMIRSAPTHPARITRRTTIISCLRAEDHLRTHIARILNAGIVVILEQIEDDWITMGCIHSKLWIAQDPERTYFARLPGNDNTSLF